MTNFEMFHLVMKHCVDCLILPLMILKGEIKDAKLSSFSSDFQILINFVNRGSEQLESLSDC